MLAAPIPLGITNNTFQYVPNATLSVLIPVNEDSSVGDQIDIFLNDGNMQGAPRYRVYRANAEAPVIAVTQQADYKTGANVLCYEITDLQHNISWPSDATLVTRQDQQPSPPVTPPVTPPVPPPPPPPSTTTFTNVIQTGPQPYSDGRHYQAVYWVAYRNGVPYAPSSFTVRPGDPSTFVSRSGTIGSGTSSLAGDSSWFSYSSVTNSLALLICVTNNSGTQIRTSATITADGASNTVVVMFVRG